jgi:hypothetical protein
MSGRRARRHVELAAAGHVQVRCAYAAALDSNNRLTGLRHGQGKLLDDERRTGRSKDGSAHCDLHSTP